MSSDLISNNKDGLFFTNSRHNTSIDFGLVINHSKDLLMQKKIC